MASYYREHYAKEGIIYSEIIKPFHPDYKYLSIDEDTFVYSQVIKNHLNIEFLLEQTIAIIGSLGHSAVAGQDYCDESECKTTTLHVHSKGHPFYRCSIKDIYVKKDLIRVVVFNKHKSRLDFFLFTLSEINYPKDKSKHLYMSYNSDKDSYSKFQKYKVDTFEELCQKQITDVYFH